MPMCDILNSETLLVNYFARTRKKEVTFMKLREIRNRIEIKLQRLCRC